MACGDAVLGVKGGVTHTGESRERAVPDRAPVPLPAPGGPAARPNPNPSPHTVPTACPRPNTHTVPTACPNPNPSLHSPSPPEPRYRSHLRRWAGDAAMAVPQRRRPPERAAGRGRSGPPIPVPIPIPPHTDPGRGRSQKRPRKMNEFIGKGREGGTGPGRGAGSSSGQGRSPGPQGGLHPPRCWAWAGADNLCQQKGRLKNINIVPAPWFVKKKKSFIFLQWLRGCDDPRSHGVAGPVSPSSSSPLHIGGKNNHPKAKERAKQSPKKCPKFRKPRQGGRGRVLH